MRLIRGRVFRLYFQRPIHRRHQNQREPKECRKKRDAHMVCNHAEKRRHKARSDIRTCHLHADYRLGFFRAEMRRRGMNYARINRGASKPNQNKSRERENFSEWNRDANHAQQNYRLSEANHLRIVQFESDESACRAPYRNSRIKKRREDCGRFRLNVFANREKARRPQSRSLFHSRVAEKTNENFFRAGNLENLF